MLVQERNTQVNKSESGLFSSKDLGSNSLLFRAFGKQNEGTEKFRRCAESDGQCTRWKSSIEAASNLK